MHPKYFGQRLDIAGVAGPVDTPSAWLGLSGAPLRPVVQSRSLTLSTYRALLLAIPFCYGERGSNITAIKVVTEGDALAGSLTLPDYQIVKVQSPKLAGVASVDPTVDQGATYSAIVADAHAADGSDWADIKETTVNVGSVVETDPTRSGLYYLAVRLPYSSGGASMRIRGIYFVSGDHALPS